MIEKIDLSPIGDEIRQMRNRARAIRDEIKKLEGMAQVLEEQADSLDDRYNKLLATISND